MRRDQKATACDVIENALCSMQHAVRGAIGVELPDSSYRSRAARIELAEPIRRKAASARAFRLASKDPSEASDERPGEGHRQGFRREEKGRKRSGPAERGTPPGLKEGMMRCIAHRSALRDKQKQGEEGNHSLAGSQYKGRR